MINKLIKLANDLDKRGFKKEADLLDELIKKSGSLEGSEEELEMALEDENEDSEEDPLGESHMLNEVLE
jgi:hypothetical protein